MSTVDNKQARVAALIEKGKKNGSLTQKEIQDAWKLLKEKKQEKELDGK